MVTAITNHVLTGDKSTLTPLVAFSIVSFLLSLILFGVDLFISKIKKGLRSKDFLTSLCLALCGVSFLVIFIRGPLLGGNLNDPLSLLCGALFMLGVTLGIGASRARPEEVSVTDRQRQLIVQAITEKSPKLLEAIVEEIEAENKKKAGVPERREVGSGRLS